MGYYTEHELEVLDGDTGLIQELLDDCEAAQYSIDSNGGTYDQSKWYSHERDMREFSKKHPKALFMLSGEGEESGDMWREYYRDGKMQKCKVQLHFNTFNPAFLS